MVPSNALQRTRRIRCAGSEATCFTIDVDTRHYLITAKHVMPADVHGSVDVEIQHAGSWHLLPCRIVGLGDGDIDIAVLAPPYVISPSLELVPTTKELYLSQDAYFLGFPYGLHADVGALNADFPLPLVKKACVSMLALQEVGPQFMLLDGHNNPGFSGGPVVYSPPGSRAATNVMGVVSGYRYEWNPVFSDGNRTPLAVQYNTGIVVVYSINHVLQLIHSNPIGVKLPAGNA